MLAYGWVRVVPETLRIRWLRNDENAYAAGLEERYILVAARLRQILTCRKIFDSDGPTMTVMFLQTPQQGYTRPYPFLNTRPLVRPTATLQALIISGLPSHH